MTSHSELTDLAAEIFLILRCAFFDEKAQPITFKLRDKRNTQDDPLDEYVHRLLSANLPRSIECLRSPGPLITPDLVIIRSKFCETVSRTALRDDLSRIVAIEVKKLQRTSGGSVARSSGMDYNTTPPCGTVRVYDADGRPWMFAGSIFLCVRRLAKGSEDSIVYRRWRCAMAIFLTPTSTITSPLLGKGRNKLSLGRMATEPIEPAQCSSSQIPWGSPNLAIGSL